MKYHIVFLSAVFLLSAGCSGNFHNTAHSTDKFKPSLKTGGVESAERTLVSNPSLVPKPSPSLVPKPRLGNEGYSPVSQKTLLDNAAALCEDSRKFWQKGENRKALAALDQAYSLILEMESGDDPNMTQQKEDLRVMISKRILEIYASGKMLASGRNKAIPMIMNSYIRDEIAVLMRTDKTQKEPFIIGAFRRSGKYRPFIIEELKKAGLPEELSWLPLIESGFRVYALSNARALGLWQFIQSTGSRFGLKRNQYVDERLDPEKATKAAVAYLKELHDIFGDWTTVLAAYNCGEGRILSVIRKQNVNYFDNFWDIYKDLPQETAQFVPRFLAALHIIANPKEYGLDAVNPHSPPDYEIVNISDRIHLKDAAAAMGISQESLKELNPELRCNVVPGNRYPLKVPPNMGGILLSKTDGWSRSDKSFFPEPLPVKSEKRLFPKTASVRSERIFFSESKPVRSEKASDPKVSYAKHEVKKGETLWAIARQYDMTLREISQLNSLSGIKVRLSQVLTIPRKNDLPKDRITIKTEKPDLVPDKKHEVKKGETLWAIAEKYDMTLQEIRELNNIKGMNVRLGQMLNILPKKVLLADKACKKAEKEAAKIYLVKQGDVAFQIAKRHNISLDRLLKINDLSDPSKIYPGQTLHIE